MSHFTNKGLLSRSLWVVSNSLWVVSNPPIKRPS